MYGTYGNVLREVAKLEGQFAEPVVVHIADLSGQTVYKILVGVAPNRATAESLRDRLQSAGFQGFIKDLAQMYALHK